MDNKDMTETEKLIRDIETLRESIQLVAVDLFAEITPAGRQTARVQIDLLQEELRSLLERLWDSEDDK